MSSEELIAALMPKKRVADVSYTRLEWRHLDGTICVAGWDTDTGECSEGGGPVTPRIARSARCSPSRPCEAFNEGHLALWGECFYERGREGGSDDGC